MLQAHGCQAHPGFKPRGVADHRQFIAGLEQTVENEFGVRICDQRSFPATAIGHHRGGQHTVIHLADGLLQEDVEDPLVLDALFFVDGEDLFGGFFARQRQPHVDHGVDGRGDGIFLGLHEIGQGIVEIEDHGLDMAIVLMRHCGPFHLSTRLQILTLLGADCPAACWPNYG